MKGNREEVGMFEPVAPGVGRLGVLFVNVFALGEPGRPWLLVDAGLAGSAGLVRRAVAGRFGAGARPEGILLTRGLYAEMGSPAATAGLARDLFDFAEEQTDLGGEFSTFVASFEAPTGIDEGGFEGVLWAQLQRLHEEDRRHHAYGPSVSPDPEEANFAFSFAGRAFFVVGLHAASSRFARRFAWPTLVFNAHRQFERLREDGRYARLQEAIRRRERDLQSTLNPNLAEFGTISEARQYSGRPAEPDWRCPFHTSDASGPAKDGPGKVAPGPEDKREDDWTA